MSGRAVPHMTTDEEAEAFLDQDLSDLDLAAFQPLDPGGRGARAGRPRETRSSAAPPHPPRP
ncbi:MAG: hypothetical protein CMN20_05855 [Roseovarius sp.]|nr:hypothetical protein [Roseovarius sp.]